MGMDIALYLKNHNKNKAKLESYRFELRCLENELIQERCIEKKNEVIESLSLRKNNNAMSASGGEDSGSKVERIVTSYRKEFDGQFHQVEKKRERIRELQALIFSLNMKVEYIEKVVLVCLTPKEKFIISEYFIEGGYTWLNMQYTYNHKFNEKLQIDAVIAKKNTALKKIESVIQETESCILRG